MTALIPLIVGVIFFFAGWLVKERHGETVLMYLCFASCGAWFYEYLSQIAS